MVGYREREFLLQTPASWEIAVSDQTFIAIIPKSADSRESHSNQTRHRSGIPDTQRPIFDCILESTTCHHSPVSFQVPFITVRFEDGGSGRGSRRSSTRPRSRLGRASTGTMRMTQICLYCKNPQCTVPNCERREAQLSLMLRHMLRSERLLIVSLKERPKAFLRLDWPSESHTEAMR
jgi:hypothetical protein